MTIFGIIQMRVNMPGIGEVIFEIGAEIQEF